MKDRISVAIDAMSGDHGLDVTLPAAVAAISEYDDLHLLLVGDRSLIETKIATLDIDTRQRLDCVHSTQIVEMHEPPTLALRTKKDSSMRVAINLIRENRAQACVSAGNTGALTAISRYILRTLAGIDRPAIITALPTMKGHTYMLDLGANVDCKAEHLFQFAVMGAVLASAFDGLEQPRIGLLNIGEETIKGNDQIKEADRQLRVSKLNYIGYVEANRIYEDVADVVIADGFVGNIALKTAEGTAAFIAHSLKQAFNRNLMTKFSAMLAQPTLKFISETIDARSYNGASLLGLQGVVIKSHGGADQLAFKKAIEVARLEAIKQVPQMIDKQLEEMLVE
ncbi:MAG: phosphate acyltransferase PlsX [Chromatiales bacterium]|nr:phosphate acyltransferase PlsX [Chromatiales bacterium]